MMPRSAKKTAKNPDPLAPSLTKPDVDLLLDDFLKDNTTDCGVSRAAAALTAGSYLHGFTDALVLVRIRMASLSHVELKQFILREEMRGKLLGTEVIDARTATRLVAVAEAITARASGMGS